MLKRLLKFMVVIFLAVAIGVQSRDLFLAFFVFYPMLLFPALYFLEDESLGLFWASLGVMAVLYLRYLFLRPMLETAVLGVLAVWVVFLYVFYRRMWRLRRLAEQQQSQEAYQILENLRAKHHSRLESLHHLENQVSGLLDLFEISKDFNDTLSFEGIAAILGERVRPQLFFKEILLILSEKNESENTISRILCVNERGVQDHLTVQILTESQVFMMEKAAIAKTMVSRGDSLIFPIAVDGDIAAFMAVEGSHADDLAKFEVLSAYLALQIKKVRLYETVKELSIHDGLTGVFVRRHFSERFDEEIKRSMKFDLPLAVLMLDIDQFKRYNDTHGHLAGDATLKQVALLLRQNLRRVDIVARYGGEEFIIVTPETQKNAVLEVAERIRSNIARHNFKVYNDQTRVTVSIGVALYPEDAPESLRKGEVQLLAAELIHRADQALYRAKEEGRNRIICYQDLKV